MSPLSNQRLHTNNLRFQEHFNCKQGQNGSCLVLLGIAVFQRNVSPSLTTVTGRHRTLHTTGCTDTSNTY